VANENGEKCMDLKESERLDREYWIARSPRLIGFEEWKAIEKGDKSIRGALVGAGIFCVVSWLTAEPRTTEYLALGGFLIIFYMFERLQMRFIRLEQLIVKMAMYNKCKPYDL